MTITVEKRSTQVTPKKKERRHSNHPNTDTKPTSRPSILNRSFPGCKSVSESPKIYHPKEGKKNPTPVRRSTLPKTDDVDEVDLDAIGFDEFNNRSSITGKGDTASASPRHGKRGRESSGSNVSLLDGDEKETKKRKLLPISKAGDADNELVSPPKAKRNRESSVGGADIIEPEKKLKAAGPEHSSPHGSKKTKVTEKSTPAGTQSPIGTLEEQNSLMEAIRSRLAEVNSRTLYVRRLPNKIVSSLLKSLCPTSIGASFSSIKRKRGNSYAFIQFKSAEAALKAMESIQGKVVGGHAIKVEHCLSRAERISQQGTSEKTCKSWLLPSERKLKEFNLSKLHIGCIPRQASEAELRELFPEASAIEFHTIKEGEASGTARLCCASHEDALKYFNSNNGILLHDVPLVVNFAFKKHMFRGGKKMKKGATDSKTASKAVSPGKEKSKSAVKKVKQMQQRMKMKLPGAMEYESQASSSASPAEVEKKKKKKKAHHFVVNSSSTVSPSQSKNGIKEAKKKHSMAKKG